MKILIDDARPQRVERALAAFPLLGVTTNPTILRAAEPSDFASDLARLRGLAGERDRGVTGEEFVERLSMSEEDYVYADFAPGFFGAKVPEF